MNVAGDYTMTFIADSTCAALPNGSDADIHDAPSNAPGVTI